jgi:hypothetical protein
MIFIALYKKEKQIMFCSNCGQEIDSGERFCSKCGSPAKKSVNTKKGISPLANILIILAVVVLIAGVVLAVVFLGKSNQKTLEINGNETTENKATITEKTSAAENTNTAETTAAASDYNIGEKGPAGGLIFYVNPNYESDGWKYLEAAPSDFPGSNNDYHIQWDYRDYRNNPSTGAIETVIGTGKANTQKIVNIQSEGNYAAKLCDDLTLNGYNDWFMPSKDELNLMFENLNLKNLGSFASEGYWSSSEYDRSNAWDQHFGSDGHGRSDDNDKVNGRRVRAVRAF